MFLDRVEVNDYIVFVDDDIDWGWWWFINDDDDFFMVMMVDWCWGLSVVDWFFWWDELLFLVIWVC